MISVALTRAVLRFCYPALLSVRGFSESKDVLSCIIEHHSDRKGTDSNFIEKLANGSESLPSPTWNSAWHRRSTACTVLSGCSELALLGEAEGIGLRFLRTTNRGNLASCSLRLI